LVTLVGYFYHISTIFLITSLISWWSLLLLT
jgi:hypothetical protein